MRKPSECSGLAPFILALALLTVVPATPAPTAYAQDDPSDPGFLLYQAEARKILKSAGNKVWDAAEAAKRSNFFQYAHEQCLRAIKFDPDQADAREYLGYVRKGKNWVLDDEEVAKVKTQNVRGSANGKQESQESFDQRVKKWKDEVLAKTNEYVAARYSKLGDACAKKGFPLQAKKGYEYALRLDPDNKAARKGLGYKKMGKIWLTAAQEQAIKDAGKSAEVKEESRWDGVLGTTTIKAETQHIRIQGVLDIADVKEIAEVCEMVYAYYLSDLGRDPTDDVFRGTRATLVFMEDGDQWNKWVDNWGGDDFTRTMGGTGNTGGLVFGHRMRDTSNQVLRKDSAIHQLIHMMNLKVFNLQGGAWINEGLAYYFSIKAQETCLTHCVAQKKGRYDKPGDEGGIKDWNDATNWKPNVRELVSGKSDLEFRELVLKPITQLEFEATIKAWSMITWMMDGDREKFVELIHELGGQVNHANTIEAWWEKGLEEIDVEWREYVLRNY